MKMISSSNLAIGFDKVLMDNINLELNSGQLTVLMGKNGIGKSCLLKSIARLIKPLGGKLFFDERNYQEYSSLDFAKILSVVLTDKFQIDYLTVFELISLGRSPYTNWFGQLTYEDELAIEEVLKLLDIKHLKNSYLSMLSDGQKQKAMIARALAQKPRVLVLDEPTTFLDIPSKISLFKSLQKMAKSQDLAILLSTHELELSCQFADVLWLMGEQNNFICGTPKDLSSQGVLDNYFKSELE